MTSKVIIITAGTAVTLPADWNPSANTIEVWAGGYSGTHSSAADGGGPGGGYALISNFGSPSTSYTINIGAGGSASVSLQSGGSTWLSNTGSAPTSTSQGVLAASFSGSAIGNTTYAGGAGGAGASAGSNRTGGGGGGAAGPTGVGNNGSSAVTSTGGAGGSGSSGAGGAGGSGDSGTGPGNGVAGAQYISTSNTITGTGLTVLSPGTTAGSGGGGGGSSYNDEAIGGDGGLYGGGGGGGNYNAIDIVVSNGGAGGNGVLILTYTPLTGSSNFFPFF